MDPVAEETGQFFQQLTSGDGDKAAGMSMGVDIGSWPGITLEVSEHFYVIFWIFLLLFMILLIFCVFISGSIALAIIVLTINNWSALKEGSHLGGSRQQIAVARRSSADGQQESEAGIGFRNRLSSAQAATAGQSEDQTDESISKAGNCHINPNYVQP